MQELQPKIYDIYLFRDIKNTKRVFPSLYVFLDDIRIYLITYNVICTYFNRTNWTTLSNILADKILFFIYRTYFASWLNKKLIKINKNFNFLNLIKLLSSKKIKDLGLENFHEDLERLSDEKLLEVNKKQLMSDQINFIINRIIARLEKNNKEIKEESITYDEFVNEVCYFSSDFGPSIKLPVKKEKLEKINKNKKYKDLNFDSFMFEKFQEPKDNDDLFNYSSSSELEAFLEFKNKIKIFKIKLGERLLNSFEEGGIINTKFKNSQRIVEIFNESDRAAEFNSDLIKEKLDQITNILPTSLPMLCEPNKWSDKFYGGYLNNSIERHSIITGLNTNNNHIISNSKNLFLAINYSSSIKFTVNAEVLDFNLNNKEVLFKDYYSLGDKEAQKDKQLQDLITLEVAKTFKNIPFYLNTFADWRGRIYTHSYYLSYQGSELAISLINFSEGEYLNEIGLYFLKIHGANLFNEDNISRKDYFERVNWVITNEDKNLSMDLDFILKADSIFPFIAFCFSYKNYKENKKIKMPIWLDATCSGLQHFSAILKDGNLGYHVNLVLNSEKLKGNKINTDSNVKDIYTYMIEPMEKDINKFGLENIEYSNLRRVKITRKQSKPTIMTRTYNVTIKGIANALINTFEVIKFKASDQKIMRNLPKFKLSEKIKQDSLYLDKDLELLDQIETDEMIYQPENNKNKEKELVLFKVPSNDSEDLYLTYKEVFIMAQLIYKNLFKEFPSLKKLFDYFTSVCKAFSKLGLPILWFPPSGLIISQRYLEQSKSRVNISISGNNKTLILNQNLPKTNTRRQTLAIIPNIIHSMDASHLIWILKKACEKNSEINPTITIHDCFGTLPNKMIELEKIVKLEFINLYSHKDFLTSFHENLLYNLDKNKIKYEIKEDSVYILTCFSNLNIPLTTENSKFKKEEINFLLPPKTGKLNLDEIKNSKYMIT